MTFHSSRGSVRYQATPCNLHETTAEEALYVTHIYSVADQLPENLFFVHDRRYRARHRTGSHARLVGGGNWPQPGEISLALFRRTCLVEMAEFGPAFWKCCVSRSKTRESPSPPQQKKIQYRQPVWPKPCSIAPRSA